MLLALTRIITITWPCWWSAASLWLHTMLVAGCQHKRVAVDVYKHVLVYSNKRWTLCQHTPERVISQVITDNTRAGHETVNLLSWLCTHSSPSRPRWDRAACTTSQTNVYGWENLHTCPFFYISFTVPWQCAAGCLHQLWITSTVLTHPAANVYQEVGQRL